MMETIFKIIGWGMFATPIVVFFVISFNMIKGASQDDEIIMALALLGLGICGVGGLILILFYVIGFTFN